MKLNKKIIAALGAAMLIAPSAAALNSVNMQPVQAAVHHRYGHVYRDHRAKYVILQDGYAHDGRLFLYRGYEWIHNELGHPEKDVVTNAYSRTVIEDFSDTDNNIKHAKFFNTINGAEKYWAKYAKRKHFSTQKWPLRIKFNLTADQWNKLRHTKYAIDSQAYDQGKDAYCTKYDLDPNSMRPWKDIKREWGKGAEGEGWDGDPRIYDVDNWNV